MDRAHPFRFGVICERMQSAEEWIAKARFAESAGYSTFLIRDHFIREPFGDQLAPMVALMAAADATKTLRVGNLVLDNDYRHPVMLAKEAARTLRVFLLRCFRRADGGLCTGGFSPRWHIKRGSAKIRR